MMRAVSRSLAVCALLLAPIAASAMPESFSGIVEPLMPAVVNISTTQKVTAQGVRGFPLEGIPNDPAFDQFRDLFREFNQRFGGAEGMSREVTSLGSGFVIDPAGYVVTNNHVIENAENITVIFSDDTHLPATLVGHDPKTDLALLKVTTDRKLPFVRFGDSDALKVGDWVVAVGNPFGLGGSVSAGIVSARGRNIHAGPFDDFIQTDAAINRGNSGGPLFNTKGEVVGINAAIFSPTGTNIGIGFAVPSAMAKPIIQQLRTNGAVHRGWLGVKIQEVTDEIAEAIGLGKARGAMVLEVGGPAAGSGIQPGDVIIAFDGAEIREMRFLPRMVADAKPGQKVKITVWRKGREHRYDVKLGELPGEQTEAKKSLKNGKALPEPAREEPTVLGMALAPVTPGLRAEAGLPKDVQGLVITALDRAGGAAKRGMLPGDLIAEVNQQKVDTVPQVIAALDQAKKQGKTHVLFKVWRRDSVQFITVPLK